MATELLDLRHSNARQLRPLLQDEALLWQQLLDWDYQASTDLLLSYIDSRILPGYVAIVDGKPEGFTFGVYEAAKAVLGDCFSRSAFQRAPGDQGRDPLLQQLLDHLIELLRATPGVDRIESQLLLLPAGALASTFARHQFQVFPRLFMECPLPGSPAAAAPPPPVLGGLHLRRWRTADLEPAAELIHRAYQGHIDAEINDQYRSAPGSLRFLHNIVRFPGCGFFEPTHSWVLEEPGTPGLAGMLLCSRIAPAVAHITQLCLRPDLRRRGLGPALLHNSLAHLTRAGFQAVSLTVTEGNTRAVSLYRQSGFSTRRRFDAAALDLR